MKEDCLENLVFCLESNPDKDIVFSDMDYVDDENKSLHNKWSNDIPMSDFVSDENITLAKFFHGYSHIAYPAALIKMEAIKSIQLDISMVMLLVEYFFDNIKKDVYNLSIFQLFVIALWKIKNSIKK